MYVFKRGYGKYTIFSLELPFAIGFFRLMPGGSLFPPLGDRIHISFAGITGRPRDLKPLRKLKLERAVHPS